MTIRKSVCFLVSDFLARDYETALRIARRRHDLIPIIITDPREIDMPNVGFVELEDPETGELALIDTASRAVRRRYAAQSLSLAVARETLFRRMDTDTIEIRTDRSYVEPLVRFFHKRERRR